MPKCGLLDFWDAVSKLKQFMSASTFHLLAKVQRLNSRLIAVIQH